MKILLSVKPEYIDRIFNGTKGFEYRRKLAKKPVDTIVLYATSPIKKIVGEVQVLGVKTASPSALWEQTKHLSGISREKYRKYFKGHKKANAYILGQPYKYTERKKLEDYGVKQAPQSYVYLDLLE